jgi:hypothetical protein
LTDSGEPECYEEAMQVDTKKKWEQCMKEEMDSLENNQTWDMVQFPTGKISLQNKWVYKLKEEDGGEKRYKARLVVKVVSRYMKNPGKEHWEAVKWILRYLRGTTTHALCFGGSDTFLQGYVDSDMAGDKDNRRSTTGYVFTIGGTTVSWISKLQKVVALSTTEAEYVAATEASKEMIWLQRFMEELGKKQENNRLYCDSQSAIHLAKNSAFHSKTKNI